jgi:hypothetical protein
MNGFEMDELHNVSAQSPANNDGLFWNASTSLWSKNTIAGVLGYTPANGNIYTANGTLTGNRTVSLSTFDLFFTGDTGTINTKTLGTNVGTDYAGMNMYNSANELVGSFQIGGVNATAYHANNFIFGARKAGGHVYVIDPNGVPVHGFFSAGNVGINTGVTINASSQLQVDSTTRGFLAPRMTTTQKNAIASPATGLQVYDTTLGSLNVYNGTSWIALGAGGGGSMAIGGAITSATAGSVLFAGTSGVLAQDNANLFWDDANNRLGIGTATPLSTLHVNGTSRFVGSTFTSQISAAGRFLIGNPTESTFILDVNGTARVSDVLTLTTGTTKGIVFAGTKIVEPISASTYTQLLIQPSSGNKDAVFQFAPSGTATASVMEFYSNSGLTQASRFIFKNNNSVLQIGADGAVLPVTFISNNSTKMQMFGNGNFCFQNGGTFTDIPCAAVNISSTTQGLLFPKMTTTQKNAITPVVSGLVVFDTTLNKLCVYSGSAWETITSI